MREGGGMRAVLTYICPPLSSISVSARLQERPIEVFRPGTNLRKTDKEDLGEEGRKKKKYSGESVHVPIIYVLGETKVSNYDRMRNYKREKLKEDLSFSSENSPKCSHFSDRDE